ncbi:hypothetical protein ACFL3V_01715 [Nanoarchaeota archaeon]
MAKESDTKSDEKTIISDKERADKGQILCRIVLEVLGAPKDYVNEAVQMVVDKVHKTEKIDLVSENTYEAEEKGKMFSAFSELEIWFNDMDVLMQFLFNFTPSSVEVMQPSKIPMDSHLVSGFFNDFLLKMHDMGLKLKNVSAQTQVLQKNADALVRNFFNTVLTEPRTSEDLSKMTGIPKENVEGILENFEKAGVVKKQGDKYLLCTTPSSNS